MAHSDDEQQQRLMQHAGPGDPKQPDIDGFARRLCMELKQFLEDSLKQLQEGQRPMNDNLELPGRKRPRNDSDNESRFSPETKESVSVSPPIFVHAYHQLKTTLSCLQLNLDATPNGTADIQVSIREFFTTSLVFLMSKDREQGELDIIKDVLRQVLLLQQRGIVPPCFKVIRDAQTGRRALAPDFSDYPSSAPVDSGLWCIVLLRSYTMGASDPSLAEQREVQDSIIEIVHLCMQSGFNQIPALLCAEGCSTTDKTMEKDGYPIEIQALFYYAIMCAQELLKNEHLKQLHEIVNEHIPKLKQHIQNYYWLDHARFNAIYCGKAKDVDPDYIPEWVFQFMPLQGRGGYFAGNFIPPFIDFRIFLVGNCISILSALATVDQAKAIVTFIVERWDKLIGFMPMKASYPALEKGKQENDMKDKQWSRHNAGSWPALVWLLTAACIKTGNSLIAEKAIKLVEERLLEDQWPEYYDGEAGELIGLQARRHETWTMAGYVAAKLMLQSEDNLALICLGDDDKLDSD